MEREREGKEKMSVSGICSWFFADYYSLFNLLKEHTISNLRGGYLEEGVMVCKATLSDFER